MQNPTPAPWEWEMRADGAMLFTPDRGYLVVMDFVRDNRYGAAPRFASWDGTDRGRRGGVLEKATAEILRSHPDALLMRAAPTLRDALDRLMAASRALADCRHRAGPKAERICEEFELAQTEAYSALARARLFDWIETVCTTCRGMGTTFIDGVASSCAACRGEGIVYLPNAEGK